MTAAPAHGAGRRTRRRRAASAALVLVAAWLSGPRPASAEEPAEGARAIDLAEAIAAALSLQPSVRSADARARSAQASVDLARAAFWPTASMNAQAIASAVDQPIVPDPPIRLQAINGQLEGQVNLQAPLYDCGRTAASVEAAREGSTAAEADREASRYRAALEVTARYLVTASDQEAAAGAQSLVSERQATRQVVHEMVMLGLRPALDERRAQLEVDAAQLDFESAQARVRGDEVDLAEAAGLDPAGELTVSPVDDSDWGADDDPGRAATDAARSRVELDAARARAARAAAESNLARLAYAPSLSLALSGSATHTTVLSGIGLRGPAEQGQATLTVSFTLFDAAVGARQRTAAANAEAAAEEARGQLLAVRSEAIRMAVAVKSARLAQAHAERLLADTALNRDLALDRYRRGVAPVVDELIDAEGRERAARTDVLRAKLGLQLARFRLSAATAGPAFVERLARPGRATATLR